MDKAEEQMNKGPLLSIDLKRTLYETIHHYGKNIFYSNFILKSFNDSRIYKKDKRTYTMSSKPYFIKFTSFSNSIFSCLVT